MHRVFRVALALLAILLCAVWFYPGESGVRLVGLKAELPKEEREVYFQSKPVRQLEPRQRLAGLVVVFQEQLVEEPVFGFRNPQPKRYSVPADTVDVTLPKWERISVDLVFVAIALVGLGDLLLGMLVGGEVTTPAPVEYDMEQRNTIREKFATTYRRQLWASLACVPIVAALSCTLYVVGIQPEALLQLPTVLVWPVSFAALIGYGAFTLENWRCPGCRGQLGAQARPTACQHCGADFTA